MRLRKETTIYIAGLGLMLTGAVGSVAGAEHFSSREVSQKIENRQDEIAVSIERPLNRDLAVARQTVLPSNRVSDEKYFGNITDCSVTRRSMLPPVDSACGLLEIAQKKESEWSQLLKSDTTLQNLNLDNQNQDRNYIFSLLAGLSTTFTGAGISARAGSIARWRLTRTEPSLTALK